MFRHHPGSSFFSKLVFSHLRRRDAKTQSVRFFKGAASRVPKVFVNLRTEATNEIGTRFRRRFSDNGNRNIALNSEWRRLEPLGFPVSCGPVGDSDPAPKPRHTRASIVRRDSARSACDCHWLGDVGSDEHRDRLLRIAATAPPKSSLLATAGDAPRHVQLVLTRTSGDHSRTPPAFLVPAGLVTGRSTDLPRTDCARGIATRGFLPTSPRLRQTARHGDIRETP